MNSRPQVSNQFPHHLAGCIYSPDQFLGTTFSRHVEKNQHVLYELNLSFRRWTVDEMKISEIKTHPDTQLQSH
jgi:hypothetical protein